MPIIVENKILYNEIFNNEIYMHISTMKLKFSTMKNSYDCVSSL